MIFFYILYVYYLICLGNKAQNTHSQSTQGYNNEVKEGGTKKRFYLKHYRNITYLACILRRRK